MNTLPSLRRRQVLAASVAMGWMPFFPQFDRSSLDLADEARAQGREIPEYVAEQLGSGALKLAVTDPDLPEEFNFPRAFAHWLVHGIPAHVHELIEGASGTTAMPAGAIELASDFVTFRIPGFGRGWGGPWPPDRQHRYVFTVYALKVDRLALAADADFNAFAAAVMPAAIASASFTAVYGPARKPLPSPEAAKAARARTGGANEQVQQ